MHGTIIETGITLIDDAVEGIRQLRTINITMPTANHARDTQRLHIAGEEDINIIRKAGQLPMMDRREIDAPVSKGDVIVYLCVAAFGIGMAECL